MDRPQEGLRCRPGETPEDPLQLVAFISYIFSVSALLALDFICGRPLSQVGWEGYRVMTASRLKHNILLSEFIFHWNLPFLSEKSSFVVTYYMVYRQSFWTISLEWIKVLALPAALQISIDTST